MTAAYSEAVEATFIKSLRSVLLVDDAFPTLADLEEGVVSGVPLDRFKEMDRGAALYKAFRKRHLPCDVENSFADGDVEMLERMRKCDLVVLDFHLDADEENTSISLEILSRLAESEHFNTIILYTKAPDLKDVWLDIAAVMRHDLRDPRAPLEGRDDELAPWERLDLGELPVPGEEALVAFLMSGKPSGPECKGLISLIKAEVGNVKPDRLLEAYFREHVKRRVPSSVSNPGRGARVLRGRCEKGRPMWLQSGRCFVVVINKHNGAGDEAQHIFGKLHEALLDWRPNFLQMLISEIQNRLELEALATDSRSFSDPTLQAGLSHYLLSAMAEDPTSEVAVESTVDRILETVRHKISSDASLEKFARVALADRQQVLEHELKDADPMVAAAAMAHLDVPPDVGAVMFFLNSFLSSESFGRSRITTGTVFRRDESYWMVMSPACDLTGRKPLKSQAWTMALHPVRAVIALRAVKTTASEALSKATLGKHAFIRHPDGDLALELFPNKIVPTPEIFFVEKAGLVGRDGRDRKVFRAAQVVGSPASPDAVATLSPSQDYEVIGQLRANYASRVLQFTSGHLGRIGVDFFNADSAQDGADEGDTSDLESGSKKGAR